MFTLDELDELDALLDAGAVTKMVKAKSAGTGAKAVKSGKGEAVPVRSLEAPVAVGLVLMTELRVCRCCKKAETLVTGVLVKYSYKGGVAKRPLGVLTEVDYAKLMDTKSGTREIEARDKVEIEKCADCSAESLRMWNRLGMYS